MCLCSLYMYMIFVGLVAGSNDARIKLYIAGESQK